MAALPSREALSTTNVKLHTLTVKDAREAAAEQLARVVVDDYDPDI